MIVILYWYLTNFDVGGVNWPIPPLSSVLEQNLRKMYIYMSPCAN